ncbi:MAG: hypothetical protein WC750_05025 [Patescibacteria group bacterium]
MALLTSLVILLLASRAQAALPTSGSSAPSQECIRVYDKDLEVDGQHSAVITISADVPNCQLRKAFRMFPILGDDKNQLSENDWLRSVYAVNQGKHPTVKRGCVPTGNHQPPADANEEERKICADGVVNYYGLESKGGRAYIHIPTTRMYTFFEQQALAASKACSVLMRITNPTDDVRKALVDCAKSQVKGENQKPILPPLSTENQESVEDVPVLKDLFVTARFQMAALKIQVTHLKYDLRTALADRRSLLNVSMLSTVCLGLVLTFGGVGGVRQHRAKKRLAKQVKEQSKDLASVQAEAAVAMEEVQASTTRAEEAKTKLGQLQLQYDLLLGSSGDLGPVVRDLNQRVTDQQEELNRQLKVAMDAALQHHQAMADMRHKHEEAIANLRQTMGARDKALADEQAKTSQLENEATQLRAELQTAQDMKSAVAYASAPTATTPPPPSTVTSPPSTATSTPGISCPSAQASYRKNTLDFQPPTAEQLEIHVLRTGLLGIIDSRCPNESKILGNVEAEDLVTRAKELVGRGQPRPSLPPRGYEIAALDKLNGFELSSYALAIFRETETRWQKGERIEFWMQSVDDIQATWRFLKTTRVTLSQTLELVLGDQLKDFFLDDIVPLAQMLNISQAPPVTEVRSIVQKTMVPPDKIPDPNGSLR